MYAPLPPRIVLQTARQILDATDPGARFVAYELVHNHPGARAALDAKLVERFGRGMSSWGEVDAFGYYIGGPAWRDRRISDATVLGWASSADRWWRRAALVSTIAMTRRGGPDDVERSLAVCRRLVHDRDDMVVKALSWALREIVKQNARSVRRFLSAHRSILASRVVREVTSKIRTGRKNGSRASRRF